MFLKGYARYPFRDFESYLRVVVGLDEDDIHLVWKQNNSKFVTNEISSGIYSVNDLSDAGYTNGYLEGTLKHECEDISMETKLFIKRFD